MKTKKIFTVIGDNGGCTYHRVVLPHSLLMEMGVEDISIDWKVPDDVVSQEDLVNFWKNYDIVLFSRYMNPDIIDKLKAAAPDTKLVMDVDDYWELDTHHIMRDVYRDVDFPTRVKKLLQTVDFVITTTEVLAAKIRPFNKNIIILPNALIPSGQFARKESEPTKRIRLGIVGGISHYTDIELMEGVVNMLPKEVLDKVQFVLCGFDKAFIRKPDGEKVLMDWKDNKWNKLERILTDNYKNISPEHYQALMRYEYGMTYDFDEPYKRVWARNIGTYASLYDEIDVLLAPLNDNEFNRCKSELKLVEASVKGKPAIVSDVFPYKICGINAIEKGGDINHEGNCLMVDGRKGARGWVKAITRIVNDNELRNMIKNNLMKLTEEGGTYNLVDVTNKRIEFYRSL